MHRPPDPQMRSPAAGNGRANRKLQCSAAPVSKYSPGDIETSVDVYFGRNILGTIDQVDGLHYARSADGTDLGAHKTRIAAARAFSEDARD